MTALGALPGKVELDPRPKGGGRTVTKADTDPPFDGVLSDVGSEAKTPDSGTPAGAVAEAGSTNAAPADAASAEQAINADLAALLGTIGGNIAGGAKTKATDPSVASLLKRMTSKSAGKESSTAGPGGTALQLVGQQPSVPTAVMIVGTMAPEEAPVAAGVPAGAQAVDRALRRQASAASIDRTPVKTSTPITTDVSVSTHLRPDASGARSTITSTSTESKESGVAADPASGASVATDANTDQVGSPAGHGERGDKGATGAPPTTETKEGPAATAAADGTLLRTLSAPVQTIAAAIKSSAAQAAAASKETASSRVAPARTLTLQISPTDLGTVDVRMHISDDGLDIQLNVADQETLGVVTREREALTSALQGQHYELHSLVIQEGRAAPPPGGHHANQGSFAGSQSSGSDARSGGQDGKRQNCADRSVVSAPRGDNPLGADPGGGALLV